MMTAMAAEAGDAAVESEAADASSAGRKITTRGPSRQRQHRLRSVAASAAGPEGAAANKAVKLREQHAARARATRQRQPLPSGVARNRRVARQTAQRGAKTLTGNYHGAVFGEWLAAVLLIAALPFAKPNKTGVSPYSGKDMVQLLAITVVYLILAILAVPGKTSARFAAWFGALLLLAIGLAETANIASAVSAWLNPGSTAAATTAAPKGNPSTVNPGSTAPAAATATGISRNVAQNPGNGLS